MYAIRSYYVGPKLLRFGSWVPYVGGFCTAFGIVDAYLHGASTQEILLAVLLICILTVTGRWVWNRIDRKVQKGEQNELYVITSYSIHYTKLYETTAGRWR